MRGGGRKVKRKEVSEGRREGGEGGREGGRERERGEGNQLHFN